MVIVRFDEVGLIQGYVYENIGEIELNKNTILFSDNNYNNILSMNRLNEIQYLFNAEEFKIIDDTADLNKYFVTYVRDFKPPFETNSQKILKLENDNIFLTKSSFDLDFRLFEVECLIQDSKPVSFNMNDERKSTMNQYLMAKKLIIANAYEREEMEYRLGRYKDRNVITQSQYDELIALMDANEIVEKIV